LINGPMLLEHKATRIEYSASLNLAITNGSLAKHEGRTYVSLPKPPRGGVAPRFLRTCSIAFDPWLRLVVHLSGNNHNANHENRGDRRRAGRLRVKMSDRTPMALKVGDIYRLEHSGFAARIIEPPQGGALAPPGHPFLIETLLIRARWYVNEHGEPDSAHGTPKLRLDSKINGRWIIERAAVLLAFVIGLRLAFWVDRYVTSIRHH
jgi:hypothetical protein